MEQSQLNEILQALKLQSEQMDQKMDTIRSDLEAKMDAGFERVDQRFDRLEKKVDGTRVELTETQETVDYLSSKMPNMRKSSGTSISSNPNPPTHFLF